MKKVYSQVDFDPVAKFYLFDNNDMIGFQTANILDTDTIIESQDRKGNLELPLVISDDEDKQDVLIEYSIEVLKSKGTSLIIFIKWSNENKYIKYEIA